MKRIRPGLVFYLLVSFIALGFTQIRRARVHSRALRLLELKVRKANMSIDKTLVNWTILSDTGAKPAIENIPGKTRKHINNYKIAKDVGGWKKIITTNGPWLFQNCCNHLGSKPPANLILHLVDNKRLINHMVQSYSHYVAK